MGLSLSVLAAALGVAQFERQAIALQWIFAFVIMAILFISTAYIAAPLWLGREISFRRQREPISDQERAPLLNDD